jgi:integrase
MRGRRNPPLDFSGVDEKAPLTFDIMALSYLADYVLHQYRTLATARGRVEHLRSQFGGQRADAITTDSIRSCQILRRKERAEAATINRETSALSRMFHQAIRRGRLDRMPMFPQRLPENPPRQGFFEHGEYLKVRTELPAPFQDVLDFAYYSGWRREEITQLTWDVVDLRGGVIRLSPLRSNDKNRPRAAHFASAAERTGAPPAVAAARAGTRLSAGRCDGPRVAARPSRCLPARQGSAPPAARLPRTAARNLVRTGVPERVAMLLTGHKTRSVFDRYNIVNERELLPR